MSTTIEGLEDRAVIDQAVLESLIELGGDDLVKELAELYLTDAPEHLAKIECGIASADKTIVERSAHTLKSSSANIGVMRLSEVSRRIEECGRQNALDLAKELLSFAQREFEQAKSRLTDIINR